MNARPTRARQIATLQAANDRLDAERAEALREAAHWRRVAKGHVETILDLAEQVQAVVAEADTQATRLAEHSAQMLELGLASRILPDLADLPDLMAATWPVGDAPLFDEAERAVAS